MSDIVKHIDEDARDKKLFNSIRIHLNHLEGLAVAYTNGVVDRDTFVKSYKETMSVWFMRYKGALDFLKGDCGCTWAGLARMFDLTEWKPALDGVEVPSRTCPAVNIVAAANVVPTPK